MNYAETLQYLYNQLPVFHFVGSEAYKPGLQNTTLLMEALNHPYKNYKTIHVAGTNGKGSVSHFLSAIFQSAGYKVGLYTSPHLVDFGERIKVDAQLIDKQYVIDFVADNSINFEKIKPSFFEATMAMAFAYFDRSQVDIAIIEVGLGGRLDSTNIITPELSIITNISFDHTEYLGNTIAKIAAEKAGIIKKQIPVVIGETNVESEPVFREVAAQQNSEIYFADKEYNARFSDIAQDNQLITVNNSLDYRIGLTGTYQLKNIATVLKSMDILKPKFTKITPGNIVDGLKNIVDYTGLMGRWQCFGKNPSIFMDTAHNYAGVCELVQHIKNQSFENLHLVFGMVKDKDITNILEILPTDAHYYFSNAAIARALPAENLKLLAQKYELHGNSYRTVAQALEGAKNNATENDLILVFGSNFVVGEAIVYQNQKES